MECPKCNKNFHPQPNILDISVHSEPVGRNFILYQACPSCKELLLYLKMNTSAQIMAQYRQNQIPEPSQFAMLVYPKKNRKVLSNDIPAEYQKDFNEALGVLETSSRASAALSRYCLQKLLIEKAGVKKRELFDQIQEVLDSKQLPTHLASDIDAIRAIGNFGAHPIKSTTSGSIVEVEAGEAEWNLNVLEGLFDFYFIAPAESQRKKIALNQKLQDAGKPQIK